MEKFDRKTEVMSVIRREERELTAMSDQILIILKWLLKKCSPPGFWRTIWSAAGLRWSGGWKPSHRLPGGL